MLTRFDFAQNLLYHEGKPLSLTAFPWAKALYEVKTPRIVFKAGRQVTKSTTLRNLMLVDATQHSYFKTTFITPLRDQASRFSNFYLRPGIHDSPVLRGGYWNSKCKDDVMAKQLTNGSIIQLTYCHDSPDRARGIPADKNNFDEIQDIPWDFLPVINESLSASKFKYELYSGTPKTLDGTLETLWLQSSQHEWIMECPSCGKFNIPIEEYIYSMIKPHGLSCAACGKLLDVYRGMWHPMNPDAVDDFVGFHIPQIIVPRNIWYNPFDKTDRYPNVPKAWRDLWRKYKMYPPAMFANEVLGLSYDSGGRLITLRELKDCCILPRMSEMGPSWRHGCSAIVAGVDWGISGQTSFTVLTIGGLTPEGKFVSLFAHKFQGQDVVDQVQEIIRICRKWRVDAIGCDFGVGYTNNLILKKAFGWERVFEYQYGQSKHLMHWNSDACRYMLNRTHSLNWLFFDMKRKHILFPHQEDMVDEFFPDILTIFQEITETPMRTYMQFHRNPHIPDDFTHSLNFAWITARKLAGDSLLNMKTSESIIEELARQDLGMDESALLAAAAIS